jgi:DtxR family transcriptional regulator, Mn-dependent transcriptional regulator
LLSQNKYLGLPKYLFSVSLTISEENYLKTIWHLLGKQAKLSTNDIAAHGNIKAASVTAMLQKLKSKKLIQYQPYYGVKLTKEGEKFALQVVRKHRLWESFLSEKLKIAWEEVHDIAEQLEHVSSPLLIERLDAYLGHPKTDPHGDPIPAADGSLPEEDLMSLKELPLKKTAIVLKVNSKQKDLLALIRHYQIGINSKITITNRFEFDESIELRVEKAAPLVMSSVLAANIYVKII